MLVIILTVKSIIKALGQSPGVLIPTLSFSVQCYWKIDLLHFLAVCAYTLNSPGPPNILASKLKEAQFSFKDLSIQMPEFKFVVM